MVHMRSKMPGGELPGIIGPVPRRLKVVFVCSTGDIISTQRYLDFEDVCASSGLKGWTDVSLAGVDTSNAKFAEALKGASVVVPSIHTIEFHQVLKKKIENSILGPKPYVMDTFDWDRSERDGIGFGQRLLREIKRSPAYIARMQ